jgi:hypothetical protein
MLTSAIPIGASSKVLLKRASASFSASSARFRSVTSRSMAEIPTTPPSASLIGDALTATEIKPPSFLSRSVSY